MGREEAQKSSKGSSSPLTRKPIKPNMIIPPIPSGKSAGVAQPQTHEIVRVAPQVVKNGASSPTLSQGSIDNGLKSRLEQTLLHKRLGAEVASTATASGLGESKTDTGVEDSEAREYKPRLQMIKAQVEKRRQEAAQAQAAQAVVNSNDAGGILSASTFVSRPGDVSPITIPPLVPPKPPPGRPSGDSTIKGQEGKSSPFPPPLKTEETGGGFMDDEEEPPPLPARTAAMFELEKSPPMKTKRAQYTNVSVASDNKEDVSVAPPPPTDTNKKDASKKKTNYPRVLLKRLKDKKEKTPEPSTSKTKGKDTSLSPAQSPTRKTNESPTGKGQPILRSNSEHSSNKSRPSSGPVIHVRPPMFINMRERPLPQIPGEIDSNFEEPPDHTAEDYEQFELGQADMQYYANYSNDPSHNYEPMGHQPPVALPGRIATGVHRAHSFNPGDKIRQLDPNRSSSSRPSFERSNFDPLPIPPISSRSTESGVSDYVDGYVNTELPMQLPTRERQLPVVPSGMRGQQNASDIDHTDYDYPDLRQHGFMAHTLPTRRKNQSPLVQSGTTSGQWGSDGYPSIQQWANQAASEPEGDERLDSDYVPMSSAFGTMDDSYINWETIKDIRTPGGVAGQGQQQIVVPPRGAGQVGFHPHPGYAVDDMYVNMPHGTSSTAKQVSAQDDIRQRLLPARGFSPNTAPSQQFIIPPVSSVETVSVGRGTSGAPPSPKPKPKARQRSATTAAALEEIPLASVAPGSPHPPTPQQAWRMPPPIQPPTSQQAGQPGVDPSIYQNIDPSASFPMSFGHHLREGLERRSSESDMLQMAIKPTAAALPPRNIPRRPQH